MTTESSTWRDRLPNPFWNETEDRPRALWRIAGALVLVFALSGIFVSQIPRRGLPMAVRGLAAQAVFTTVSLSVLAVWARYVDRRPLADYGVRLDRRWFGGLALGVAVGVVGWAGALATDLAFGWARIEGLLVAGETFSVGIGLLVYAANFALVAVWEETLFRGIFLLNAVEGFRSRWLSDRSAATAGLIISSFVFAAGHAGQAGTALALGFWFGTGLLLGAVSLSTGQLAVPIGLHFAFDFAVNNLFGLSNVRSLGERVPSVVSPVFTGPERFVEVAGLVNTVWLAVIAVTLLGLLALRHGSLRVQIGQYAGR